MPQEIKGVIIGLLIGLFCLTLVKAPFYNANIFDVLLLIFIGIIWTIAWILHTKR